MNLLSAKQTAERWGISQRRVSILCNENRIDGAVQVGKTWVIPDTATKPVDGRTMRYAKEDTISVKPFVKWAGGKGQLLSEIQKTYPKELGKTIKKYAEPFIGGGAVLFDIVSNYELDEVYISDINKELICTYNAIKNDCDQLIERLKTLKDEYMGSLDRKEYYYDKRANFNTIKAKATADAQIDIASLFIFLNRTCFNGLYRVNKKGEFNVPMGDYKNPTICDEENLRNISKVLQRVTIVCGDYKKSEGFIDKNTFVYFDPPYRPLTETSAFNSYTENGFTDANQEELAEYAEKLMKKGAKVVLSNSDPKNANAEDNFFDDLYKGFNINRISATRMINSRAAGRGKINELLIQTF